MNGEQIFEQAAARYQRELHAAHRKNEELERENLALIRENARLTKQLILPNRPFDDTGLVGIHEIADVFGIARQVVTNWKRRYPDFPAPLATLRMGPVWMLAHILQWQTARRDLVLKLRRKPKGAA